jgi:cytochrome c6
MKRIVVALALVALAAAARADETAALFQQKCASCHGKDGKGSPVGLKMGAPDLTKLKDGEPEILNAIANGKGKMTAYKGKLADDQIKSLAKYVKGGLK